MSTSFLCNENIVMMRPWWFFALFSPINRLLDMTVIRHLSWKKIIMSNEMIKNKKSVLLAKY